MIALTQLLGAQTIWLFEQFLGLRSLFWRTVASLLRRRFRRSEVIEHAYNFANKSLLFLFVTMGFVGMIMVFQACFQAQRLLGDMTLIGPAFLQLVIREFAPTIGGLMIATRVGAGIAAEIGSMNVTEQIDALRMNGADPVDHLVAPRILAGVVTMLSLGIFGALFMFLVGGVTAKAAFSVPYSTFFNMGLIKPLDVMSFLNKCVVYGFVIPLVAAHAGFVARGGSEGVGSATTRSVIECSLWILMFDLGIGAFYFILQRAIG
ncbi:MAG: ABC transporter permease [Deltaproteobacteria bacterium]|nr:ABC transporter permease [Deltaproteobacteria bacterium]